jgi:hypothetical protein
MMTTTDENSFAEPGWSNRQAIRRAVLMKRDIRAFHRAYPSCEQPVGSPIRGFTWEALERQLSALATDPVKAAMAGPLVSATRKQARFKPPEMVLREILCLASTLMDESFDPSPGEEADDMT